MKESKAALLSPEDQEDVESPLPSNIVQPVRRRGAISAEPINEEDAATYIKKVIFILCEMLSPILLFRSFRRITKRWPHCPKQLPRMFSSVTWTRMREVTYLMPCFLTPHSREKSLSSREMKEIIST